METVRVFVGVDRSQMLAVKVLEHSIKRHTDLPVEVTPMLDLPLPIPKNPKDRQRTGFSFSRFCIPKFMNYQGRAIYMDADMLVFKDIAELWNIPFNGSKVIIQEEIISKAQKWKLNAPKKRRKQCAVMLLDCSRLDWKIENIVQGLDDGKYSYEELMYDMCLLKENEISYNIPFKWNSLEYLDNDTCLIHYTDMMTQPWVSSYNSNDQVWYDEVNLMLQDGSLSWKELEAEIERGYFRPTLKWDINYGARIPGVLAPVKRVLLSQFDALKRYHPHRKVRKSESERMQALKN